MSEHSIEPTDGIYWEAEDHDPCRGNPVGTTFQLRLAKEDCAVLSFRSNEYLTRWQAVHRLVTEWRKSLGGEPVVYVHEVLRLKKEVFCVIDFESKSKSDGQS